LEVEVVVKIQDGDVEVVESPTIEQDGPADRPGTGRKPPREGLCRRCGKTAPINRLMLCYPCWVKTQLEEKGWREGQPHPRGCGCWLDCRHDSKGGAN
jgi:hypothetical protein